MGNAVITPGPVPGRSFLGARETKKVAGFFSAIEKYEKAAAGLGLRAARAYFDAGNILFNAMRKKEFVPSKLTAKALAEAAGFPEHRITLSLKLFKAWEHNPEALKSLSLREAVRLIAPPPDGDGYNRVDLGGDPGRGQAELDFGELFGLPTFTGAELKTYRVTSAMLSEIIVVRRTEDGQLINKRFARFAEDVPQDPLLRAAFKAMAEKTQAAVEEYLGALEQYGGYR
jgi:hypothetical protein